MRNPNNCMVSVESVKSKSKICIEMMQLNNFTSFILMHFILRIAGTTGAVLTCPLEVLKTRLQSSSATFHRPVYLPSLSPAGNVAQLCTCINPRPSSMGILMCLRHIIETEGLPALFKGLGPNLVGVAPSRAIYFCAYDTAKKYLNNRISPESKKVHMLSAMCAGE
ncbi:solute carrier family 25 member 36-A-like [Saccoglossus kowalevskii]